MPKTQFDAIVLAADREQENLVAKTAGVPCKALAKVGGKPMLARVLDTLGQSPYINRRLLCGPPKEMLANTDIETLLTQGQVEWIAPQPSPSLSVLSSFAAIDESRPALLTTADSALLSPEIVNFFCSKALACDCDVVVGLVRYQDVITRIPRAKRTTLKFSDGPFCSCNLFAFLTPKGRQIVSFWRRLEQERKHPWRLIRALGPFALLLYLLGRLSTDDVTAQVKKKLGIRVKFLILPFPEAAVDVDSVEDWKLAQQLISSK
ncbi:MAG: hypothetical protein AXA67_03540 [Methylothermaceae bacteria B42]|nr:MAG: hypothetical protein AXA67_03540 [Methylothermaceae bacteria B42]HHJ38176.1 MobA-like NTP transferase domain containing protein [Methylothermaceae bacterium]